MDPNLNELKSACENGDYDRAEDLLLRTTWGKECREECYLDSFKDETSGDVLLHVASRSGKQNLVSLLCDFGANVNIDNNAERTPLHVACELGQAEVVDVLLNTQGYIGINAPDAYRTTPLHYAALSGHLETVSKLLNYKIPLPPASLKLNPRRSDDSTPLHLAARDGHSQIVRGLVAKHAAVNCVDTKWSTPLHNACANGYSRSARVLMAHGADRTMEDNEGKTPGQRAIDNGWRQFKNIIPP